MVGVGLQSEWYTRHPTALVIESRRYTLEYYAQQIFRQLFRVFYEKTQGLHSRNNLPKYMILLQFDIECLSHRPSGAGSSYCRSASQC